VKPRIAFVALCAVGNAAFAQAIAPIAPAQLRSGTTFQSQALRTQQSDDAQNPGMLWVEMGKNQFDADCQRCHADASELARKLPRTKSATSNRAENLDDAINACVEHKTRRTPLRAESEALLAFNAYLMHAARGTPRKLTPDLPATAAWRDGRATWFARQGKQDLSCALCHDAMWGKTLRNQTISQGHTTGYPTYRQEWQRVGSAERRMRACYFGMEATVPAIGTSTLRNLELYAAWRAGQLAIEAPAVRR
jgi:L-cysteine S-thiosulfotransferase